MTQPNAWTAEAGAVDGGGGAEPGVDPIADPEVVDEAGHSREVAGPNKRMRVLALVVTASLVVAAGLVGLQIYKKRSQARAAAEEASPLAAVVPAGSRASAGAPAPFGMTISSDPAPATAPASPLLPAAATPTEARPTAPVTSASGPATTPLPSTPTPSVLPSPNGPTGAAGEEVQKMRSQVSDLIAKSEGLQARVDDLTKERQHLQAQLAQLREERSKPSSTPAKPKQPTGTATRSATAQASATPPRPVTSAQRRSKDQAVITELSDAARPAVDLSRMRIRAIYPVSGQNPQAWIDTGNGNVVSVVAGSTNLGVKILSIDAKTMVVNTERGLIHASP